MMQTCSVSTQFALHLPIEELVRIANEGCDFTVPRGSKLSSDEHILIAALIEMGYINQIYVG